jgi:hypothetical protein
MYLLASGETYSSPEAMLCADCMSVQIYYTFLTRLTASTPGHVNDCSIFFYWSNWEQAFLSSHSFTHIFNQIKKHRVRHGVLAVRRSDADVLFLF